MNPIETHSEHSPRPSRRDLLSAGAAIAAVGVAGARSQKAAFEKADFELHELSIADLQAGLKSGRWTARRLAELYADRIRTVDKAGPTLRSVIELNPNWEADAKALDVEWKLGRPRGPLHGIPILVKDNVNAAGMETTAGSLALAGSKPADVLEEFIAFGVSRFLSVGTAGSLQHHIGIGDLVVCDRAIRDEGLSHHYVAPGKYAHASPDLTARLVRALDNDGQSFVVGTSWTIDAPYRETKAEVSDYQQEGVACVEMEAAALFTVAHYRGVEMGAMFTISDSLASLEWHPEFHNPAPRKAWKPCTRTHCDV